MPVGAALLVNADEQRVTAGETAHRNPDPPLRIIWKPE